MLLTCACVCVCVYARVRVLTDRCDDVSRERHVQFSHLVVIHQLDDAADDRHSDWIKIAVDRQRFARRIRKMSSILEPILTSEHRLKMKLRNLSVGGADNSGIHNND